MHGAAQDPVEPGIDFLGAALRQERGSPVWKFSGQEFMKKCSHGVDIRALVGLGWVLQCFRGGVLKGLMVEPG